MRPSALLLIDIQKDYFDGGRMPVEGPVEAAKRAYALLQCFREHGRMHVHIQHASVRPGSSFLLPGDSGSDIHPIVAHFEGEPLVVKHFPNAFRETDLLDLLKARGIRHIVLAGMMTHMCVDATARAAVDLGFEITVAADACATRAVTFAGRRVEAADVQAAYLAALQAYGRVANTAELLSSIAST